MGSLPGRHLVVGATGALGGAIATKLLDHGAVVRGMSRDPARLAGLAARGAEPVVGDLGNSTSLDRACAGVTQIVSTANSFMGSGRTSPTRVDLAGYQRLLDAARGAGVTRIVHVSASGVSLDSAVDYFRVKAQVDDVIRRSGLPYVLLKPAAFLDVWVNMVLQEVNAGRPARIFGDGTRTTCYIATEDVAEFAVRILALGDVVNEEIEVGGPSSLSQNQLVDVIETSLGVRIRRQKIPRSVLRAAAVVLRPFNELLARLMSLGAWSASADHLVADWHGPAMRFGVQPMTAEAFLRPRV